MTSTACETTCFIYYHTICERGNADNRRDLTEPCGQERVTFSNEKGEGSALGCVERKINFSMLVDKKMINQNDGDKNKETTTRKRK